MKNSIQKLSLLGTSFFVGLWIVSLCGCADPAEVQVALADGSTNPDSDAKHPFSFERMSPLAKDFKGIEQILNLAPAEAQKMNEVKARHQQKFESLYATEWKDHQKLEKEFLAAVKDRDLRKMREMKKNGKRAKMDAFVKKERSMQADFERDLINAIPATKMPDWKAYRISKLLLDFVTPLNLSNEQKAQLKTLAPTVIQSLGREKNWQGLGTDRLEKRMEASILTTDQKSEFETLKKKNKLRMLRWNNISTVH